MRAVNAMNVLEVFCSFYTVISAVSYVTLVQLLYHVSNLLASACSYTRKPFIRSLDTNTRRDRKGNLCGT